MSDRTVNILLVEDDEIDAEAVVRAFRKSKISNPIVRVCNGIEALAVLRGTDGAAPPTQPFLILLDLNMPQMNGKEFLSELRGDPQLRHHIVFVLTTSNDEQDKLGAYEKNIAGYMLKSQVGDDFIKLTTMLECFWHAIQFPLDAAQLQREDSRGVDARAVGA